MSGCQYSQTLNHYKARTSADATSTCRKNKMSPLIDFIKLVQKKSVKFMHCLTTLLTMQACQSWEWMTYKTHSYMYILCVWMLNEEWVVILQHLLVNKWLSSSEQLNPPRMFWEEEWPIYLNIYRHACGKSRPEKSIKSSQMSVSPEHPKKPPFPRPNEHQARLQQFLSIVSPG